MVFDVAGPERHNSRHSLLLSGSPPSGKLLIPLERRDGRVVEGARLESESGQAHRRTPKHAVVQSFQSTMPLRRASLLSSASRCFLLLFAPVLHNFYTVHLFTWRPLSGRNTPFLQRPWDIPHEHESGEFTQGIVDQRACSSV